jgi:hypothetical protein
MTGVGTRLGVGVVILVGALLLPGAARAAPNPYGARSTATTITLEPDGSYQVTLRESQALVREYQIGFGGNVHDGFRAPDDGTLLPPYIRAAYTLTGATWEEGQTPPRAFIRSHHRWSATSTGTYPAGDHSAELRYRVTDASRPTPRGWAVHVRLLDVRYSAGDTLTIQAGSARASGLELRCVTHVPDNEPCGGGNAPTLRYVFPDRSSALPPEFVIMVSGDNAKVPAPTLDRT